MVLASQESDVSNVTRSEARRDALELLKGLAQCPGIAEDVGRSLMSQRKPITLQLQSLKAPPHREFNGFDNETIIKVYDADSKKKNSIGKTCCYQPPILLYPTSDSFRGQETRRCRRRPDGTEKLNPPHPSWSLTDNL
jgi:hypothetical protein